MITKENIKIYNSINNEIKEFADKVFYSIKVNKYAPLLFHVEKVYNVRQYIDGENLAIQWRENTIHDCPEGGTFFIPLDKIYTNTWREWIDEQCEDIRRLWELREKEDKKRQEEREKELLKRLKNKYGEV